MSDKTEIQVVREAARELLARLDELEQAQKQVQDTRWGPGTFPRQTGAVRRQSLELTRALANLRKTGALTRG